MSGRLLRFGWVVTIAMMEGACSDSRRRAGAGSRVTALSVAPGQRITIVPTTYGSSATGSWQLRITAL